MALQYGFFDSVLNNGMMNLFNEIPQLHAQLETKGEWRKYYGSRLRGHRQGNPAISGKAGKQKLTFFSKLY